MLSEIEEAMADEDAGIRALAEAVIREGWPDQPGPDRSPDRAAPG